MTRGQGLKRLDRRKARREEANVRFGAWFMSGPKLQLQALDERLGKGVGAKKQRARIAERLAAKP